MITTATPVTASILDAQAQALDAAWTALEEAIVKMDELNDQFYGPDGELIARAPRADVSLLAAKVKELNGLMTTYQAAKAPSGQPVLLPGEVRLPRW